MRTGWWPTDTRLPLLRVLFLLIIPLLPNSGAGSVSVEAEAVLSRLRDQPAPISWEAQGVLVAEAPGEYYRMEFRLLARGPQALRLELFDPFGRPAYYLAVNRGQVRAVNPRQQKAFPVNPAVLAGALTAQTGFTLEQALGLLWGRIPLVSFPPEQITLAPDPEEKSLKLALGEKPDQIVWVTREPFRATGSLLQPKGGTGPVRVRFSDFTELKGSYWPREIRVREEVEEKQVTIRYDRIVPREDFPEDTFDIALPPEPGPGG